MEATVKPEPVSQEAYLKAPNRCPYCRNTGISGGRLDVDGAIVTQHVGCEACGATWTDTYALTGYTITDEPDTVVKPHPADLITDDMLETASQIPDIDNACRYVQDLVGIDEGGVAASVLEEYRDDWPEISPLKRYHLLDEWRAMEAAVRVEYPINEETDNDTPHTA